MTRRPAAGPSPARGADAAGPLVLRTPRCVVDRVSGADRAALLDLPRDEPVRRRPGGPRPEARREGWIADVLRPDGEGGVRAMRPADGGR